MLASLFEPLTVKSLDLKNRFVMSPMTRSFSPDHVPTDEMAAYYTRRAENDVALIITEGVGIDRPASIESSVIPRFHGEKALAAWRTVFDRVHAAGGKIAPQLWHVGGYYNDTGWTPDEPFEAPSGRRLRNEISAEVMTEAAIEATIEAFASAAASAKALGGDAINVHGAHGYLLDQFTWAETNLRKDHWGGSTIAQRGRIAVEVVKAIRAAIGPDMPILFRISQWKIQAYHEQMAKTPAELESWVQPLVEAGVDVFDCSQRRFWEPEFEGSDLNFAGWVKKLTGAVTMTVGSVGLTNDLLGGMADGEVKPSSLDELERRFDRGDFDLVAVGRTLLSDPQWVHKVRTGSTDFHAFKVEDMARLW